MPSNARDGFEGGICRAFAHGSADTLGLARQTMEFGGMEWKQWLPMALLACLSAAACKRYTDCPDPSGLLETYTVDGKDVAIYADGGAYLQRRGLCHFETQYFDPAFVEQNYVFDSLGTWIRTDDGSLFPTRNQYVDDFESYAVLTDLFATSVADTGKYWVSFTAQSPEHPTVGDYVQLRSCIMAGTCDFDDNRMEWVAEPGNAANHVVRLTAVKPGRGMVTSKMSFESPLAYFVAGNELWAQADFQFVEGMPYSILDVENPYFESSPGPRIVIMDGALAWENKFGAKDKTLQASPRALPTGRWVTIKVHMAFSNSVAGRVDIWQDGDPVLSATGKTLPTYHSIQSSIEVGISATDERTVLLLDNFRISNQPF